MRPTGRVGIALGAARRLVVRTAKTPPLLLPVVLFPLLIMAAFIGGASGISKVPGFGYYNYTAFVFVYVLLLGAAMSGTQAGIAVAQDFESGFARRMLLSTPHRVALLAGYTLFGLLEQTAIAGVTLAIALAIGMPIAGNGFEVAGVFGLAALFNVVASLWSSGIALRLRSTQAAALMLTPILLPLFFAPSLVPRALLTPWLHRIADVNPLTPPLEAGRGLLAGKPVSVAAAFAVLVGLALLMSVWALSGLRRAERPA